MSVLRRKSAAWQKPSGAGEFVWAQVQAMAAQELGLGPEGWASVQVALRMFALAKAVLADAETYRKSCANGFMGMLLESKHRTIESAPVTIDGRNEDIRIERAGDLRLSDLQWALDTLFAEQVPQSTLRRWAQRKKIPGVYPLKRGQYRVRICPKLGRWAAELHLSRLRRSVQEWERSDEMKELIGYAHAVALDARDAVGKVMLNDPRLSKAPLAYLDPRELQMAGQNTVRLRIGAAINALKAQGKDSRSSVSAVADFLNIPRSRFYRKGYDKIVKSFYRDGIHRKDPRAKKLYASQSLQETDVEG